MGDTGEAFEALNEHKREVRAAKEPQRFKFSIKELTEIATGRRIERLEDGENSSIKIFLCGGSRIDFWPYTGWYCGRKPLGHIKGRGIAGLIKEIKNVVC